MIGEPYRWQCEAERCYRQRDRAGRWHANGRDMGANDPGAGNRYHPECAEQGRADWSASIRSEAAALRARSFVTLTASGEVVRLDDPRAPAIEYPEPWATVGRWQVRRVSLASVQVAPLYRAGGSDTAIRWPDGRVAYDWPERCPLYVRRHVARMLGGIEPMA